MVSKYIGFFSYLCSQIINGMRMRFYFILSALLVSTVIIVKAQPDNQLRSINLNPVVITGTGTLSGDDRWDRLLPQIFRVIHDKVLSEFQLSGDNFFNSIHS